MSISGQTEKGTTGKIWWYLAGTKKLHEFNSVPSVPPVPSQKTIGYARNCAQRDRGPGIHD